jgi:hypothetical protein
MEFEKENGWFSSFQILGKKEFHFAFIVVRPQLVNLAYEKINAEEMINIEKNTNIEVLAENYLELIKNKL